MLQFFIGIIVGVLMTIIMVALCMSSKKREEIYSQDDFYKEQKYK